MGYVCQIAGRFVEQSLGQAGIIVCTMFPHLS